MSRARLQRRYNAYLRYLHRCLKLGAWAPYRAYGRLLDRLWEE